MTELVRVAAQTTLVEEVLAKMVGVVHKPHLQSLHCFEDPADTWEKYLEYGVGEERNAVGSLMVRNSVQILDVPPGYWGLDFDTFVCKRQEMDSGLNCYECLVVFQSDLHYNFGYSVRC